MVYSLLRALPGVPGLLATVVSVSTDLDTSVGMSGPHDFAVRLKYLRLGTIGVHRILTRVRDVRETPLSGQDGVGINVIWVRRQAIFL
jgi:hypothetical protein